MENYFIIAYDSGAKGTWFVGEEGDNTSDELSAMRFDTTEEAAEYMKKNEYVGWILPLEIIS